MEIDKKKIAEYLGEFLGTFLFVSIIFLSGTLTRGFEPFLIGFGLAVLIYTFSRYSHAHLNPAVTVGAFVARQVKLVEGLLYLAIQFLAVLAAFPLVSWIRDQYIDFQIAGSTGGLSDTSALREQLAQQLPLFNDYTEGYLLLVFVLEALFTFFFVATILFVSTKEATKKTVGMAAGLVLFITTALAYQLTGASFNPFRSLVPALFEGGDVLSHVWVYVAAPLTGAVVAGLVYLLFTWLEKPGVLKLRRKVSEPEEKPVKKETPAKKKKSTRGRKPKK